MSRSSTTCTAILSVVALSVFIWRFFTFYLPIVVGMALTLMVNNEKSALARWIKKDDVRMAFVDHTVPPKVDKKKAEQAQTVDEEESEKAEPAAPAESAGAESEAAAADAATAGAE